MGVVFALSSLVGAMAMSAEMAGARRAERRAYALALAEREAAAGEESEAATPPSRASTGRYGASSVRSRTLCLRGAETVVARVARFLDSHLIDENGRLDVSALTRTSGRATELDRNGALPQRMGRRRVAPTAGDGMPTWEPIDPPERICVELSELATPPGAWGPHGNRRPSGAK